MKSEDIINGVDLKDAKRVIIFVEKKNRSQIVLWEDPYRFCVMTAGTRRDMYKYVKLVYNALHRWMMEDIPDYPLSVVKSPKEKKKAS